jgi:hypothetical protein
MQSMSSWKIDLFGEQLDITELKRDAEAFDCTIDEDVDGKSRLGGTPFSTLSNQAEVRQLAEKLLRQLNGSARLTHPNHIPVQLGSAVTRIDENGARHICVLIPSLEIRGRVGTLAATITRADGTVKLDAETTTRARRLAVIAKDEQLAGVLEAISEDLSFQRLRVAFERLAAIVGGGGNAFVKQKYATREEVERLKSNIEHPGHSGMNAVHGVPDGPTKGEKMTEQDALIFITRLLHSHIDSKAGNNL